MFSLSTEFQFVFLCTGSYEPTFTPTSLYSLSNRACLLPVNSGFQCVCVVYLPHLSCCTNLLICPNHPGRYGTSLHLSLSTYQVHLVFDWTDSCKTDHMARNIQSIFHFLKANKQPVFSFNRHVVSYLQCRSVFFRLGRRYRYLCMHAFLSMWFAFFRYCV